MSYPYNYQLSCIHNVSLSGVIYEVRPFNGSPSFGLFTKRGELIAIFRGHTSIVTCATSHTLYNGKTVRIVSGSEDGSLLRWDVNTWYVNTMDPIEEPLLQHNKSVSCVTSYTRRHGRKVIVSGSDDRSLRLWDAVTGDAVDRPLLGHTNNVSCVTSYTLLNGQTVIVSGSDYNSLRWWDGETGEPVGLPFPLTGKPVEITVEITHRSSANQLSV